MKIIYEQKDKKENIKFNQKILREAILKVIAFFDIFDFPPTEFEIWKYCGVECELDEAADMLESSISEKLGVKNGFYFLSGRERLYDIRMHRYNEADKKYKRAIWISKILKIVPWIKMIAVANIIGQNNSKDDSDIDLFVIAEKRRIWLTRFFTVALVKFLGMRPKVNDVKNKICLSFFAGEDGLDLRGLMLDGNDIYLEYWLACLTPVFNKDGAYEKLIEKNSWIKARFPNWFSFLPAGKRKISSSRSFIYHDIADLFFGGLENNFKYLQIKIMPNILKNMRNKDTRVIANDKIIKLISNDRREIYRENYYKIAERLLKN